MKNNYFFFNCQFNSYLYIADIYCTVQRFMTQRILLEHGAEPNARNADEATALHLAAAKGLIEVSITSRFFASLKKKRVIRENACRLNCRF